MINNYGILILQVGKRFILIFDKNKTEPTGGAFLIKEIPTQEYADISSRVDAEKGRPGRWICLILIEI